MDHKKENELLDDFFQSIFVMHKYEKTMALFLMISDKDELVSVDDVIDTIGAKAAVMWSATLSADRLITFIGGYISATEEGKMLAKMIIEKAKK